MCHHYLAAQQLPEWLVDEFSLRSNLRLLEELERGFYPLSAVPVLRALGDSFELTAMEWGLLPRWWKPSAKSGKRRSFQRKTFNARCETAHEKPTYRDAFRRRRCLLPASEFFERGHYFRPAEREFCFAGLWESWRGGEGSDEDRDAGDVLSCTLLTTEPNEAVARVGHNRMPVLLTSVDDCRRWMDPDVVEPGPLARLFEPYNEEITVRAAEA